MALRRLLPRVIASVSCILIAAASVVPSAGAGTVDPGLVRPTSMVARHASASGGPTCSATAGRVAVAVVVVHDEGSSPIIRCADLAVTANGIDALRSAGFAARIERGFVCGIDGVPESRCATGPGFDGTYWRYFRGTADGKWKYASTGAGSRLERHDGCAYEAWVWSGRSEISPPVIAPGAIGCTHVPVETRPPATTVPPPTTVPPQPRGGATTPADRGGDTGGTTAPSGGPGTGGGATPTPSTSGATHDPTAVGRDDTPGSIDDPADPERGAADDTSDGAGAHNGVAVEDESSGEGGRIEVGPGEVGGTGEVAVGDTEALAHAPDGSGSPVGTVMAGLIVALVATGTMVVGRRRTKESTPDP